MAAINSRQPQHWTNREYTMKDLIGLKNATRLAVALTVLLVAGCASDEELREKFSDNLPHFFTEDVTGDVYLIEHNLGDNYSLKLWKRKSN